MKAIILAAGKSSRIQPPIGMPKALIKIGNKTLLEHSLSNLSNCGVKEAVIVVGYFADKIIQKIGYKYKNMSIKYVKNELYNQTDNLYSLWLAKLEFNDSVIYMDADILYDKRMLKRLIDTKHENAVLVGKLLKDTGEEMKVFGKNEAAKNIGRGIKVKGVSLIGEAIGMVKVSSENVKTLIEVMDCLIQNKKLSMSHEDLTNIMCEKNLMSYVCAKELPWIEIDFREDVTRAKEEIYPRIKKANQC